MKLTLMPRVMNQEIMMTQMVIIKRMGKVQAVIVLVMIREFKTLLRPHPKYLQRSLPKIIHLIIISLIHHLKILTLQLHTY